LYRLLIELFKHIPHTTINISTFRCDYFYCRCLLHNICTDLEGSITAAAAQRDFNEYNQETQNRNTAGGRQFHHSTQQAQEVREAFEHYFISPEGSVP
jgi:hypothetical protein